MARILSFGAFVAMVACSDQHFQPLSNDVGSPDQLEEDYVLPDYGLVEPRLYGLGGISGRICAPSGDHWVSNALVWIEAEAIRYETTTDLDGMFVLEGLPAGVHTVHVEKGFFTADFDVLVVEGTVTPLAEDECLQDDVEIAVVTGDYDNIEGFLSDLGFSHDIYNALDSSEFQDLLLDPAVLDTYDIVFINCNTTFDLKAMSAYIGPNLRDFVEGGGSVYASDYSYYLIEAAFPEAASYPGNDSDPGDAWGEGSTGVVDADLIAPDMAVALGKDSVLINYNTSWVPIKSTIGNVILEGAWPTRDPFWGTPTTVFGPMAYQYQVEGGGSVLYTSFHNEVQATNDMRRMIEEFIFSL